MTLLFLNTVDIEVVKIFLSRRYFYNKKATTKITITTTRQAKMFSNFFFLQKISICQNQPQKDLFVATHTHAHAVKLLTFEVSFVKSKNIPFYDQQLPETRRKFWKYPTELKVKYASSDQTTARKSVWVQVRFFPIQLNAKTAKRKHKTFIVSRKNTE